MYSERTKKYLSLALALILSALAFSWLIWFAHRASHPDAALALSTIEFQSIKSEKPPIESNNWQAVDLPDDWYHSNRSNSDGWYRYNFNLNVAPNRLWAIYLPTVQHNAEVYLNGELLGSGGKFTSPVARNWNRPLYFTITNGLLSPGKNTLHIRLKASPASIGLLSEVFLGPDKELRNSYKQRYFVRYTWAQFIVLILVLMSILLLILWWHRRQDTLYLWLSLTTFEWAIHNLNLIIINIPISNQLWDKLMVVTMLWFPVLASGFIQRFIGVIHHKVEQAIFIIATLFTIPLLLLSPENSHWLGIRITDPLALTLGLYSTFRLFKYAWQNPQEEAFLMIFTGLVLVIFGLHDALVVNYLISRTDGFFLHYSAGLGLLIFTYILLKRFVRSLNDAEALNLSLESQVEAQHQKLKQNYHEMQKLENQRILVEERERLMRDMHDGMGGHLVSTLALLDSNESNQETVRSTLQEALDDLRLMIDSMEDVDGDVVTILAMLRQRLEPRLNQSGIYFDWKMQDIPSLNNMGPENSLHLLRIFQEAITNILKHSSADTITFTTKQEKDDAGKTGVLISCEDNGKGLPKEILSNQPGRGLRNIQRRARILKGKAGVENNKHSGVKVWLWIPI